MLQLKQYLPDDLFLADPFPRPHADEFLQSVPACLHFSSVLSFAVPGGDMKQYIRQRIDTIYDYE
jgi:hypothetical protein